MLIFFEPSDLRLTHTPLIPVYGLSPYVVCSRQCNSSLNILQNILISLAYLEMLVRSSENLSV